jgi:glycosyltransferase involved in cell wall biosynthesis
MEQFALKRVDVLITQNEKRAEFYIRNKKVRVSPVIIHNYKPYEKVQQSNTLKKLLKLPNETKVIVYEGQIQGRRNLDKIVLSAKYLPDTFRLVFIGEILGTWWEESVKPLFVDPEIASRVIVMPPYPHDELIEIIAFSDAGLIIYDDSVLNNIFCEPGKLSDYIFARVPVIAPDYPTIGPVIKKYKIGQTFENAEPEEIARVIEKVVNTPREVWEQGLDAASLELTWENEWPKLKEVLE